MDNDYMMKETFRIIYEILFVILESYVFIKILHSYIQNGISRGVKTGSSNKHGGTLVRFCPLDLSRTSILYYRYNK